MWPFRRCKQPCDEQVIDKTVLPSMLEQLAESHMTLERYTGGGNPARKTVVLTIRCNACGRVRTVRETS